MAAMLARACWRHLVTDHQRCAGRFPRRRSRASSRRSPTARRTHRGQVVLRRRAGVAASRACCTGDAARACARSVRPAARVGHRGQRRRADLPAARRPRCRDRRRPRHRRAVGDARVAADLRARSRRAFAPGASSTAWSKASREIAAASRSTFPRRRRRAQRAARQARHSLSGAAVVRGSRIRGAASANSDSPALDRDEVQRSAFERLMPVAPASRAASRP